MSNKMSIVQNELLLTNLSRDQLFSSLTCESSNSNLTKSVSATINIHINCKCLKIVGIIVEQFINLRIYNQSEAIEC